MTIVDDPQISKRKLNDSGDLLATKLAVPILRTTLVRRSRLTELLWSGMQRRLTMIVAPAGYGKTTLLGEWLATISATGWPVAWISLDSYDNDIFRFWTYVATSLLRVHPELHFNAHDILRGHCDPRECTQLNPLINEISDIPFHFSLILDDCHEIRDQNVYDSLTYFIDHMPENCHLVIAGRVVPPLPLSRLRVRGQLIEINAEHLSFNIEETETFLSQVMNLEIDWDEIVTLLSMTEGWIAGLQLAALSLQGHKSPRHFLANFTGSHRHILDYLTEEVLNHQSREIKEFLLKTSILKELSAPLCDAMLDRQDSWDILDELEKANLFIVPLDEQRHWYRYHALFANSLRMQLERTSPNQVSKLHLAASQWLIENNFPEKAVPHALSAGDSVLAADIVESCAFQAIVKLDISNLIQWFTRLPEAIVHTRPRLMLYYALANLMMGKVEDLEEILDRVEQQLGRLENGEFPSEEVSRLYRYSDAVRAAVACTQGDFFGGIRTSQEVLDDLLPEDFFFLGLLEHYMAYAYQAAGRFSDGAAAQERACQNALTHEFHNEFVLSQTEKARFYRLQGNLHTAANAYKQAIEYARENLISLDLRIFPQAGLAEVYREWNQIPTADELLKEPIAYYSGTRSGIMDWFYAVDALLAIARVQMLHGEYEDSARCIRIAKQLGQIYHFIPELSSNVRAAQVQLWLEQGETHSATSWVGRRELQALESLDAIPVPERLAMTQVYLSIGYLDRAGSMVTELIQDIDRGEQSRYLVRALILSALTNWQKGWKTQAVENLIRAIYIAAPQDMLRSFLDQGKPMSELLAYTRETLKQRSSENGIAAIQTFIERLMKFFAGAPAREKATGEKPRKDTAELISPLVEPLSEREQEVMTLLAQGYSAGDVAKNLVISVNTAKAHIKNIYQKLDVHSRKEAIDRAINLQLLED